MLNNYTSADKALVAVDCIIFGFDADGLKILLIQRDFEPELGKWSLMGGFLQKDEVLKSAANRVLNHYTGFQNVYLEQFYTYSEIDRDPVDRTVSVAYYALINIENYNKDLINNYHAQWFSVHQIPDLIFDHNAMVAKAIRRLRYRTSIKPVGFELLPEKFSMRQLLELYEAILDKPLDKRNFISKINSLDILIKLNEKDMQSSRKGSFLYMFNKENYTEKLRDNFVLNL